jgi:hypothetical protein
MSFLFLLMMQNSAQIQGLTIPKRVILKYFDVNDMIFTLSGNIFASK